MTFTKTQSEQFHQQVSDRFGVLPNFFCSAVAAPGLIEELWAFAQSAYLDSPLPSLFKERLFVYLSRFCPIRYCIVRHVGFLMGLGRPAGDAQAQPQTIKQVSDLLSWIVPNADALNEGLTRLESQSTISAMPDVDTQAEKDLFEALAVIFLEPRLSGRARAAVKQAFGEMAFELLTAYLAFIRMAHYWTETHPELAYEPDMVSAMAQHPPLAKLLLDPSEAERVQQREALRQALANLYEVQQTLRQSQQREAFLLQLSDALRSLSDPEAILATVTQTALQFFSADRCYYCEIKEGKALIRQDAARPDLSSVTGDYPLNSFAFVNAVVVSGQPFVVSDVYAAERVDEPLRQLCIQWGIISFVDVPIIKHGETVGMLRLTQCTPRNWTELEVDLVQEMAERAWAAVDRAHAEEALRQSEERYRQLAKELEARVQDRTQELWQANQDLKRSNENLQQFAYVASHDLQEPLRKIQQFGNLLTMRQQALTSQDVDYIERMQSAASRMSTLIRDLLNFSRISTQRDVNKPVALNDVVKRALSTLELVIGETNAQVVVDSLPTVQGDASQLDMLFQNLLSNALKFRRADPGGMLVIPRIQLKAYSLQADQLPVSVKPIRTAPAYERIDVVDNGIGFDEKYLDRIFQVFQRLHSTNEFAGTGIGLAICDRVVTNHGGAITANSQPNQGTVFSVYFPV